MRDRSNDLHRWLDDVKQQQNGKGCTMCDPCWYGLPSRSINKAMTEPSQEAVKWRDTENDWPPLWMARAEGKPTGKIVQCDNERHAKRMAGGGWDMCLYLPAQGQGGEGQ